jgi:hypothetical protein
MQRLPLPFEELQPPVDPVVMAQFEEKWRVRIPEPYKVFLLRSNGAELALPVFHFRWNDRIRPGSLQALLTIGHKFEMRDLGHFVRMYIDWERRIPEDLFPIGTDDGGDLILMGGDGPRLGKVYYWDHNWESSNGEPPTERNVYFVADSLDEFLSNLKPSLMPVE